MTDTRFDDELARWLERDGPQDVPRAVVERAIAGTRAVGRQRRLIVLTALGRTWPPAGARIGRTGGRLLMVALLVGALAVTAVVGGRPSLQPLPPIVPDPLFDDVTAGVRIDDGRVLLLGDAIARGAVLDLATGRVTELTDGLRRGASTLVVAPLADGRVLLAGGDVTSGDPHSTSADVFDPRTGLFRPVRPMTQARGPSFVTKVFVPSAVRLPDGRVLVVGGTARRDHTYPDAADLFDPATGRFSATPAIPCSLTPDPEAPPSLHHEFGQEVRWAAPLPDGRVLLACDEWPAWPGRQAFLAYDVAAGTFEPVAIDVQGAHRALALPDGSLLLWEWQATDRLPSGERHDRYTLARYDPVAGTVTHHPTAVPAGAATVLLDDGRLLVAGGFGAGQALPDDAVSVVDPCSGRVTSIGRLGQARWGATAVELGSGRILVLGGDGGEGTMATPVEPELVALASEPRTACDSP